MDLRLKTFFRMMIMMMFVMMFMPFCGNHRIRFFLCGHRSDACFHFLSFGVVTLIGQGVLHEIQRYVGDTFQF